MPPGAIAASLLLSWKLSSVYARIFGWMSRWANVLKLICSDGRRKKLYGAKLNWSAAPAYGRIPPGAVGSIVNCAPAPEFVRKRPGKVVDDPAHEKLSPSFREQALKSRLAWETASSFLYPKNIVALPLLSAKFLPIVRLMPLTAPSEPTLLGTLKNSAPFP